MPSFFVLLFGDFEAELGYESESAEGGVAVILLLHLGQLLVGHQAGVLAQCVVPLGAIFPTLA